MGRSDCIHLLLVTVFGSVYGESITSQSFYKGEIDLRLK